MMVMMMMVMMVVIILMMVNRPQYCSLKPHLKYSETRHDSVSNSVYADETKLARYPI